MTERAPFTTHPADRMFFILHPARRYRARAPFRRELRHAKEQGLLGRLKSGEVWITIVQRAPDEHTATVLTRGRLDRPGAYPNDDATIDKALTALLSKERAA